MSTRIYKDANAAPSADLRRDAKLTPARPDAANDSFDIAAARLPSRRIPVTLSALRVLLKWFDVVLCSAIAAYFLVAAAGGVLTATVYQILPFLLIPVLTSWGLRTASAYRLGLRRGIVDQVLATAYGSGLALAGLSALTYVLYPDSYAQWLLMAAYVTWLVLNCVHIHLLVLGRQLIRTGWISENVVIVGATENAQRMIERNAQTRELNIVGIFDDRLARAPKFTAGAPLLGRLDDLFTWSRLPEIDRVIVTVTPDARVRVRALIDRLRILPQQVVLLLDLDGFDPETESLANIAHSPAAYVSGRPHDARRALSKRLFDLVFASALLIYFSPLILVLALAIKLESRGPVIFRQNRHGFNNQIIKVWKFRSMIDDPQASVRMSRQTVSDDPRITRIGRWIRRTSLDELPQLINVLRGEMSIVGPRPHAVGMTTEEQAIQSIVGDYAHRHRVKPGITGWAQINGSRGPVHTKELVRERVRYDMEYVNRSSFWFDLFIMFMTLPRLLGDANKVR